MSILYCAVPHFAVALSRRDQPHLSDDPLVLLGPEKRVFDASLEAVDSGVAVGMTAHMAQVHCPEACLLDVDVVHCQDAFEEFLLALESLSSVVEPHGWAAYVDLGDLVRDRSDAIALCSKSGRAVRQTLGHGLQPALGWDRSKFTAQAAAGSTRPGRLLAIETAREREFLDPLAVRMLPLSWDALRRLHFLGLRTLGQYASLPPAAVLQQFGRPGQRAHRYARGEDDRPVIPRHQLPILAAEHDFDVPCIERERLLAVLGQMVVSLSAELEGNLQACGQMHLTVRFEDGSAKERVRTFCIPTAEGTIIMQSLSDLLDKMHWTAGAIALSLSLGQIQDIVVEQLHLFPVQDTRERKLCAVQNYLAARFGAGRLWRTALVCPGAPLAEWRVGWQREVVG